MPLNAVSPLNLHWVYWSTGYYAQQYQNTGTDESLELLRVACQTLEVLGQRWAAAGMSFVSARPAIIDDRFQALT